MTYQQKKKTNLVGQEIMNRNYLKIVLEFKQNMGNINVTFIL